MAWIVIERGLPWATVWSAIGNKTGRLVALADDELDRLLVGQDVGGVAVAVVGDRGRRPSNWPRSPAVGVQSTTASP